MKKFFCVLLGTVFALTMVISPKSVAYAAIFNSAESLSESGLKQFLKKNVDGLFLGLGTLIYRWQVQKAAASGRGIVMNIQTNILTNFQSIWFISQ